MDKIFVLDNFNIVLDKKYFDQEDGRGIRQELLHGIEWFRVNVLKASFNAITSLDSNCFECEYQYVDMIGISGSPRISQVTSSRTFLRGEICEKSHHVHETIFL